MKFNALTTLGTAAVLAASIASVLASVDAAPRIEKNNPLRVSVNALGNGQVEVIVTNTSRKTARIPSWQLPSAAGQANLFAVSRDGEKVRYEGMLAKRGVPTAADFKILRPGQSDRAVIDLGASYDLSKVGNYTVTYAAPLQFASMSGGSMLKQANGNAMVAQGAPIRMWVDGMSAKRFLRDERGASKAGAATAVVNGVTFSGCTSTQTTQAGQAVVDARGYTENAKSYLNAGTTGPRYTTWFGAYTSSRYSTAKQHFVSIDSAMDQNAGQIKINCACSGSEYAHVFKAKPYEIFVCKAFWPAPAKGTDSKAGTLIHEMSHFTIVADTDDWAYGQTAAKNLANTNPTNALDNADNHEYFSENTPAQN